MYADAQIFVGFTGYVLTNPKNVIYVQGRSSAHPYEPTSLKAIETIQTK